MFSTKNRIARGFAFNGQREELMFKNNNFFTLGGCLLFDSVQTSQTPGGGTYKDRRRG